MNGTYVGYVEGRDPLHGFLSGIIRDRLGVREAQPAFRVFRLSGSNEVYAYAEKRTDTKIICKFYGRRFPGDREKAGSLARQEYEGLETLRGYDLVRLAASRDPAAGCRQRHQWRAGGRVLLR
jgi:hypothetical protein